MDQTKYQVVEHADGEGKLLENGALLDEVLYAYQVNQEYTIYEDATGKHEIPGQKELTGYVILKGVMRDISRKDHCVLVTTSGKSIPVAIRIGDFLSKKYYFKFSAG